MAVYWVVVTLGITMMGAFQLSLYGFNGAFPTGPCGIPEFNDACNMVNLAT